VVQESLIFTMVLDLLLLQFVLGRGYFCSKLTGVVLELKSLNSFILFCVHTRNT